MDQYEQNLNNLSYKNKKNNFGWGLLAFFIPLVGFILYLMWKNDRPVDSKVSGIGALVGLIFNLVLNICLGILIFTGNAPDFSVLQGVATLL